MSELEETQKDARAFRRLMHEAGDDRGEYVRTVVVSPRFRPSMYAARAHDQSPIDVKCGEVMRSTIKWVNAGDMPTFGDYLRSLREGNV
ncbi:hypothetical protein LMG28688_00812 [Paraburkholderia caffeinitolerans]|uniref:Uncharacterized protein n=1 Tax=Paraburkholderia caffeinitolerans TaxID=1723730 RepID=A0A6J5FFP8_9BURK|nr:hypothetical protein [Paraburkholderia caffeinitolerans]CAB3779347.1 hypothetical protein LMG28688_00812 [Paraburkholderia caffeinitolerans]